jgi:hypothetical protein
MKRNCLGALSYSLQNKKLKHLASEIGTPVIRRTLQCSDDDILLEILFH